LFIYNYTQKTQFESFWCEETENCRGLIVDKEKNIVARGFKKFWNLGEKLNIKDLPVYQPDITEKLDGSLGILYPSPGGGFAIATRGSFRSEQAQWATTWLKAKGDKRDWKENVTYLFEIIYPMNRIVVDYGSRAELVMIGMVHNWTGKISPYKEVKAEAIRLGFSYPKLYEKSLSEIEEYAKTQKTNEEGFVLFYPEDNLQIKIKLNDYVRLHRLTFGISVKSIWENMMEGKNVEEVFKDAPDEVYDWVKNWKTYFRKLEQQYMDESLKHLEIVNKMETRKEQAMYLQKEAPEYMGIVFGMLDGKEYLSTIYKKFRPTAEDAVKTVRVVKTSAL
jgi:RNA ligase